MVSFGSFLKGLFNYSMEPQRADPRQGHFSEIARSAKIGRNVVFGDWSSVGCFTTIGDNVMFGPWAKVGNDCVIGNDVQLGSHTRVAAGSYVAPGTILGDHDLVTKNGVIPDRCSGSMVQEDANGAFRVITSVAIFMIPAGIFNSYDDVSEALDLWQWGETYHDPAKDLEHFRI
ncbi:UDP-3-O-[3-hydroxymyristoyl] glucosamine N-acyltransferase [compost metagenome]